MKTIAIISSSVRRGRNSHRVALFFKRYIEENKLATAEILDLKEYNFPLFDERLRHQPDPAPEVLRFAEKIRSADGVFGGAQVLTSLQFSLWKIRAWTVPARYPVPSVNKTFDESGVPADVVAAERRAAAFTAELLWCIEANERMAK